MQPRHIVKLHADLKLAIPMTRTGNHRELYEPDLLPDEASKEKLKGPMAGDWGGTNSSWSSIARCDWVHHCPTSRAVPTLACWQGLLVSAGLSVAGSRVELRAGLTQQITLACLHN